MEKEQTIISYFFTEKKVKEAKEALACVGLGDVQPLWNN